MIWIFISIYLSAKLVCNFIYVELGWVGTDQYYPPFSGVKSKGDLKRFFCFHNVKNLWEMGIKGLCRVLLFNFGSRVIVKCCVWHHACLPLKRSFVNAINKDLLLGHHSYLYIASLKELVEFFVTVSAK